MEFTEIFGAFAVLLVGVIAIGGLITGYGNAYGDTVGNETGQFANSLSSIESSLTNNFVNNGLNYANATQATEGQGTSTDQSDNLIKRAWNSINLMRELVGFAPALMKDGANAIGIDNIYWQIGEALFWTIFSVTLAYVLIVGARRLVS